MKRLWGMLKNRWFIASLGLLALGLLIWFLGPFFAFADYEPLASEWNRIVAIGLVFALWSAISLWKVLRQRRANRAMLDELGGKAAVSESTVARESREEVERHRRRFDEAVAVLKQARLGGPLGKRYLYQLPWYIIIGTPGSGKTTALLNSGLKFPLAEPFGKGEIRGVGGTRDCDWFFTDEAVLLDTAGRYTSQDSHREVDRAAWLGFLGLLKKYRGRRPINGVFVALSIADLLQKSEAERGSDARAVRARIQELHENFGIRFPIYVLFTKCDLLAGFTEFFDDLGREERSQVWGVTLATADPDQVAAALEAFAQELSLLGRHLNDRLLYRMQQERDPQRRALIYAFPQQFSLLQPISDVFLKDVFQPTRYHERPWLRGVYFTSATQEGTPIDRVMSALAVSFGLDRRALPPQSASGKGYFITRALREVVFQESGLAGTDLRLERRRAWLQTGAYAAAVGLTLCAALLWFTSYARNRAYLQAVAERIPAIQESIARQSKAAGDLLASLPLLNDVRDLPGGYVDRDRGTPWLMGFGLYQGDMVGAGAEELYARVLKDLFLPELVLNLEDRLRREGGGTDDLARMFSVYLMLDDPDHFKAETVRAWMLSDWERHLPRDTRDEQRQQAIAHLNALLADTPFRSGIGLDQSLIRQVREQLKRIPLAQRVYSRITREPSDKLPEFRLSEAAGRDAPLVLVRAGGAPLSRGIPGLFTYAGYHEVFIRERRDLAEQLANERWIYGDQPVVESAAERQQLDQAICQLYVDDYARRWQALVADLGLVPFASLQQGVRILGVLTGPDSPVRKLLEAVERETSLARKAAQENPADRSTGAVIKERLTELVQGRTVEPAGCSASQEAYVADRFEILNRQVRKDGNGSAPIDATLAGLSELQAHLNSIASAPDPVAAARMAAASGELNKVLSRLRTDASRQPAPVGGMLQNLANGSANLTLKSTREQLSSIWNASVVPFFQKGLSGRYPLVRGSRIEVTQEDFARFFGAGGLVDDFFKSHLLPFVDTSSSQWRWNSTGGVSLGIAPGILAEFQRAAIIKDAYFRGGGQSISMRFDLKPLSMDAEITQFTLDLDGQLVSYSHGPTKPFSLQWPGPGSAWQVRIQIAPPAASGRSGLVEEGPWAWLRILDQAQMESTAQAERFKITFNLDGRKAAFELWASSVLNPFRLDALERFKCPERW